jgi:hypothetical protein
VLGFFYELNKTNIEDNLKPILVVRVFLKWGESLAFS